jgi:bifunctional DNase/RNase
VFLQTNDKRIYFPVYVRGGEPVEIEMKIRGLMMDPITNMPIVILKEAAGSGILPIWVGVYEANAIALEIEKVVTPRPMTHDLLKNVLVGLDASVRKVVVTTIKDDTFYALIWLDRSGTLVSVDSRPSDALALALRIEDLEKSARFCRPHQRRRAPSTAGKSPGRRHGPLQDVRRF